MRQAFAGMLWSKQFYNYDVATWLDGDPAQPPPPPEREMNRNARWRNFNAFDILSMPDKWEYPWFAAWDLAFHCVSLAHVDPGFAKYQLVLLCREWFQHPNGALPAYEWDFSDVNPPVQAWAALEVFALDGGEGFRLPRPDLRQAAGQLHLVGEQGRRLGQRPVRGRLPRPGQHRPDRPVAPAAGHGPRAVGRHRLDGLLRAVHGHDRAHSLAQRPPGGRRPGAQVPRALRRHHHRARDPGDVGRRRRDVLRPPLPGQRRGHPGQGQVHGRHDPAARGRRRRPPDGRHRAAVQEGVRRLPAPAGADRRGQGARARDAARRRRPPGEAAAQRRRGGPAGAAVPVAVRRVEVPVPVRPAVNSARNSRISRTCCTWRAPPRRSTTSRPSPPPVDVRRQLQLARADLVPAELPLVQLAAHVPRVLRRRLHRGVPDRVRPAEEPQRGRRRPAGAARLDLPAGRRRAAALLRLGGQAAERPELARQRLLQRVLPR